MDPDQVVKTLAAELAARQQRESSALDEAQLAIQQEVINLDHSWHETERKHRAATEQSTSEAWSRALSGVHEERRRKYQIARSQLDSRLSALRSLTTDQSIDFGAIRHHLELIESAICTYNDVLAVKRRQLEFRGDYGNLESDKWRAEVARFVSKNPQIAESTSVLAAHCDVAGVTFDWFAYATDRVDEIVRSAEHLPESKRSDGIGFEHACLASLVRGGWQGNLTKVSGDQGVDIVARKGDISVAVQCKNQNIPVGNGAVQEVHAGKTFYETDFAVVVSTSGFTPSAVQLAQRLGVLLTDSSLLDRLDGFLSR